jgi:Transcriptional regulator, AbiEi antitoxin
VTPRWGVKFDQTTLALFSSQHGVATLGQLIALRLSPRTIGRARERGELVPVLPGVYYLGEREPSFEARAMAVQLHCGESCFLNGTTAGALVGLRSMPRSRIQVTVPGRVPVSLPSWVEASMTSWFDPKRVVVRSDGLRLADPYLMLLALARQFNDHRFERAAEDAWHRRLVTRGGAATFLDQFRGSGRRGVGRFERWLDKTKDQHSPASVTTDGCFHDRIVM